MTPGHLDIKSPYQLDQAFEFKLIETLKCITKECIEGEGMVHERSLSRVARADD